MVAKFVDDRLQDLKFALKLFYVDDLLLIADLNTLVDALKVFKELEDLTGIKVNLKKTVLCCPNEAVYKKAKQMLGENITIQCTMNTMYLNCPIGDRDFVKAHLEEKLRELKRTINILERMPYLHEAWTLLKYCGSGARINHL